ncbi:MAG TPA: DNA repair protein RadA [Candidatus Saccharibacteria bacterium]|nr:DNA repair protein RadA [Candidatus Saccharibacteria bacterium]
MTRAKHVYVCQQCGANYPKWSGRCDNCGQWNTLVEEMVQPEKKAVVDRVRGQVVQSQPFASVAVDAVAERLATGFSEADDVLGGGFVPGGVALLAGEPGIGKSTLLMQIALFVGNQLPVLYISGEESASQVKLRGDRLASAPAEHLSLVTTTSADDVAATIAAGQHRLVVVDSMQTMAMAEIASAPGTVSQITNSANSIIRAAKTTNTAVVLVGHVTKEGSIAGPKVLEHLVDVVLQFEGDRYGGFKLLRAAKNRYGSTAEVALFEMVGEGLRHVDNPSAQLLAERGQEDGSVILATMEGNRPLLVEIQALVNPTHFGYPKRTASGFDLNRLNVLIAVLERRTKLKLGESDVFINVVGGLRLQDPAADLAVCMAIASAAARRKLDEKLVVFGEVGLSGEVRSVTSSDRRAKEAKKLGFAGAIAPASKPKNAFIRPVTDLRDALIII